MIKQDLSQEYKSCLPHENQLIQYTVSIDKRQKLHNYFNRFRKSTDKIQCGFMFKKNTQQIRNRRECLQSTKVLLEKNSQKIPYLMVKYRKLSLRSGIRQVLLLLLFNIVVQVLARAIKQEKEIEGIQIEKKEVKITSLADDMILNLKKLKESNLIKK